MTQPTSSPAPAPAAAPAASAAPAVQRQFVNFSFYKIDPAIRRLPDEQKWQARSEFLKAFQFPRDKLICLTYSTAGLKADCDFLLWRTSTTPVVFQEQWRLINKAPAGGSLRASLSVFAVTKPSMSIHKPTPVPH